MSLDQKQLVDQLKVQWKELWQNRIDDKIRAEGVATADYLTLFIDKGTIIYATRDFKALNFKKILEQNRIENTEKYIPPDPQVGGWTKFVKTNIAKHVSERNRSAATYVFMKKEKQQLKKGGRGWVHR